MIDYQECMKKKKFSCSWKCGWREKCSPGTPQIDFLNWFFGDILFSSLIFFLLLHLFFEIKILYSDTHLTMWPGDTKYSPGRFPETRLALLFAWKKLKSTIWNLQNNNSIHWDILNGEKEIEMLCLYYLHQIMGFWDKTFWMKLY